MPHPPVKAALVGFGRWGQLLHESTRHSDALQIVAAATRTPSKVADYCREHGIALTDDLDAILADPGVEALLIATPHTRHFEQLMAAAAAGKHVFCEKPFTLKAAEASTALTALDRAGLRVAIGHNRRFAPNTRALRAMLDDGALGDPLHIDGVFNADLSGARGQWRDSREESPAGGMTSLGIHLVDMFIHLLGPVAEVDASSRRIVTERSFDDSTLVRLRFENGCSGALTTLTSSPLKWRVTVYGSGGEGELQDQDTLVVAGNAQPESQHFPGFEYPALATIRAGLEAFARDVRGGPAFPIPPAEILHATAVLEAIIESAATASPVAVRSDCGDSH